MIKALRFMVDLLPHHESIAIRQKKNTVRPFAWLVLLTAKRLTVHSHRCQRWLVSGKPFRLFSSCNLSKLVAVCNYGSPLR
jgi:hypothetical protein